MVTALHKFQQLVFILANQKLIDFLDELQKMVEDAFRVAAEATFDQVIYTELPPRLKKSINQGHLENSTYKQIVTHLERVSELTVWKLLMKLIWTTRWSTNNKLKTTKIMPEKSTVIQTTLTTTKTKMTECLELSTLLVRHVAKRSTPQREVLLKPMHQTGHFLGRANQEDRLDLKDKKHNTWYMSVPRQLPNLWIRN